MKPILCNTQVVKAILDGRQTQDRRPIKLDGYNGDPIYETKDGILRKIEDLAPYKPSDTLYIREAWRIDSIGCIGNKQGADVEYKASGENVFHPFLNDKIKHHSYRYYPKHRGGKFSPNQHMFKEFVRIFLTVKKVWIERIQDISENDAFAEGYPIGKDVKLWPAQYKYPRDWFENFWNSIYGPDAWDRNDWVWCTEFEIDKNLTKV